MNKLAEKARREGYKARSVYKLFEIDKRYKIIKRGDSVLDLGCWPGSWIQASLELGAKKITGVDKRDISNKDVTFINADILNKDIFEKIKGEFDVVLSDVAPHTSGIKFLDQGRSYDLSFRSFEIACRFLKENGNFLVKIFQSEDTNKIFNEIKKKFGFVKIYKPMTSRSKSKEVYIIAKKYRKD